MELRASALTVQEQLTPRQEELEQCFERYPDVPREVIVKEDVLRMGVRFSPSALAQTDQTRPRTYYIFSYDRTRLDDMQHDESKVAPEEARIAGGRWSLRPTLISARVEYHSPYEITAPEGRLLLTAEGAPLAEVEFPPLPAYYDLSHADGTPYSQTAGLVGWGTRAFTTVLRGCQLWGEKEECQFCDLNSNSRALRQMGRPYKTRKEPEMVAEVLEEIFLNQPSQEIGKTMYLVSGGTVIDRRQMIEADDEFYLPFVRAIKRRLGDRWPMHLQTFAKPKERLQPYKDAGVDCHHANIEVWDKRLFQIICPGKAHFVGYDQWLRWLCESVEVFGEGRITPSFVIGVELSEPNGFATVEEAVASTSAGFDYLMSHGVTPRAPQWCIEPLTVLGKPNAQKLVPLDFFIQIDRAWFQTWKKYKLPKLHGWPNMGPGNCYYQNGAFLDMGVGEHLEDPYGPLLEPSLRRGEA
ncbi:MAG: radical SAM protein [Candidatus Tectomicrobia bacterium]|nr:radical SAM protein [Candidatus Tectomicrobia bacterium]